MTERDLPTDTEPVDEEDEEVDQLYEHYAIRADQGQEPLRVDRFLVNMMPKISRNRIQRAASSGFIFVNGEPVKSNYKVKPLDRVSMRLERPPMTLEITPQEMPLEIVYEDDWLLVVNKPAGLVVHPGHGNWDGTLLNGLAWYLRNNPDFDVNDPAIGLVHRIDKDTSGLLVIAKTAEVKSALGKQFFDHSTRREYVAVIWGHMDPADGVLRSNLARDPRDRTRMAAFPYEGEVGKTAVTHYATEEYLGYLSQVRCRLETGRTHQIRVHLSNEGHPLFNDAVYGGDRILRGNRFASYKKFVENAFAICPRQALHAQTLGFFHPILKRQMDFSSTLPPDMTALIEKWRKYVDDGNVENL
ncbi:MAG: RluA family pseudouridine synthase [Porphyromonas sp.]|uniref:RluA family pseudouridine synthase n=1 Tax=Porphyromonas sp. TaxID=1924944 RepID=UPI002A91C58A|nr:RluA family pseudouridine synthase [Porphyromonas sp.]MDD7468519.1 RluA family pseudouridine synthase [Bacteroidales bacterium]MDY6101893.1 RluA family pseudouridine synthase [Porphyromonas sp.]